MNLLSKIKNIFGHSNKMLSIEELDNRYVVVTNVYSYPILVTNDSALICDIESADYHFDMSVPNGKGRVYKFSEGLKIWGDYNKESNVCPSPVLDSEKSLFKKDKESIVAYAKSLGLCDLVIDTLISGCDGYSSQVSDTFYDERGNRISK